VVANKGKVKLKRQFRCEMLMDPDARCKNKSANTTPKQAPATNAGRGSLQRLCSTMF
jgi:hypothetical protein